MSVNDITGDSIKTGAASEDCRSGYDAIWGKAEKTKQPLSYESELRVQDPPEHDSALYLARSRAVIAEWWGQDEKMFSKLDELEAE